MRHSLYLTDTTGQSITFQNGLRTFSLKEPMKFGVLCQHNLIVHLETLR